MKINLSQLEKKLTQTLSPLYLLSGEEIDEALAMIIPKAQQQDFNHIVRLDATNAEHTDKLSAVCFNHSLMDAQTLIIARFSVAKSEHHPWFALIERFALKPPADKILIIILDKLTQAQLNTNWLKQLTSWGVWLHLPLLSPAYFNVWLKQILQQQGYILTPEAWPLLLDQISGNKAAAKQILTKLSLIDADNKTINEHDLIKIIIPSNHHTVFDLINAINHKQINKIVSLLSNLQAAGIEPAIILWALAREVRRKQQTAAIDLLFKTDQIIKGLQNDDIWRTLMQLSLMIAGQAIL